MNRRHFEAEHEMFRKSFREFVKHEIVPHYDAWERAGITPKDVWKKAGANGLETYSAGSEGPAAAEELLKRDGRSWRKLG